MVEMAEIEMGLRVLEPSAGTGNLLKAVQRLALCETVAVEIDSRLCSVLERDLNPGMVICADFLAVNLRDNEVGTFDRVVMNPPFANGADIQHIKHAVERFLRPGGVLVALCANGPRQRAALLPLVDSWEDLPVGSFKSAGTDVNVALLMIRR